MFFRRAHDVPPKPRPGTQAEGTELRIARGFYTYFGWFPWGDFEGEHFSEEHLYHLTVGRADPPMPGVTASAEADPSEEADPPV